MAKKFIQPRLCDDVAVMVITMAKRCGRTVPGEVNHVLRTYYTEELSVLTGVGPGEPMPPTFTRLNPLPAWTEAPLNLSFGATKKSLNKIARFAKKMTKLHNGSKKRTHAKHMTDARG